MYGSILKYKKIKDIVGTKRKNEVTIINKKNPTGSNFVDGIPEM